MACRDFFEYEEDFFGGRTFGSAAQGDPWVVTDTSASGAPTVAVVTPSNSGEVAITLDATNEVENVCLSWGDKLAIDIDKIRKIQMRVKLGAATMPTASRVYFGLGSARNDAIASVTNRLIFSVDGAVNTTAVVLQTSDGTHTNSALATGATLTTSYKWFEWDFSNGTGDVRAYIDGQPVATGTTIDMSSYTGGLQPIIQLQKTASTDAPVVTVDAIFIEGIR